MPKTTVKRKVPKRAMSDELRAMVQKRRNVLWGYRWGTEPTLTVVSNGVVSPVMLPMAAIGAEC